MNVLLFNGSAKSIGNTCNILAEFGDELGREGIETENIQLYSYDLVHCNDCRTCEARGDGRCADETDGFNDLLDRMRDADGIVFGCPAYGGGVSGKMQIFLERASLVLETDGRGLRGKTGAVIAVSAHDGAEIAYMHMVWWMLRMGMAVVGACPMPVFRALASSQYGGDAEAAKGMKRLAQNMAELVLLKAGER